MNDDQTEFDRIRDWFERHRNDYCDCQGSPPAVWSTYMALLLTACGAPPKVRPSPPRRQP